MRISDWSSDVCSSDLDSGWGVNLAYTYSDAEENRTNASNGETYYFDGPRLTDRFYMSTGVPKHRLVLSGIYDLGWDTTFSGQLRVGSTPPRKAINWNDVTQSYFFCYEPLEAEGNIGYTKFNLGQTEDWDVGDHRRWTQV